MRSDVNARVLLLGKKNFFLSSQQNVENSESLLFIKEDFSLPLWCYEVDKRNNKTATR